MKLGRVMLVAAAVLVLVCAQASGQEVKGKFAVTPQIGLVIPTGDFADTEEGMAATTGFAGGLAGEYYVTENVAFGAKFLYNRFGWDTGIEEEEGVDISANWTVMVFGAFAKYVFNPAAKTRFFGRGGVIMGKLDGKIEASAQGISAEGEIDVSSAIGLELGVGMNHMLTETMAIFGEVGFTHLMTDGKDVTATAPGWGGEGEFNLNTQWFGVKAGVTFFLGGQK